MAMGGSLSTAEHLLDDFRGRREYRAEFVVAHAKHLLPIQVQELIRQENLTQSELAKRAALAQSTVSRAADIEYGDLSINTCVRLAAGFDVDFICGFVPFSEFLAWIDRTEGERRIPTFSEEYGQSAKESARKREEAFAKLQHHQMKDFGIVPARDESHRPLRDFAPPKEQSGQLRLPPMEIAQQPQPPDDVRVPQEIDIDVSQIEDDESMRLAKKKLAGQEAA